MATELFEDDPVQAQPGEEFTFSASPGWLGTQYHIQVDGAGNAAIIGVWGPNNPVLGKARNKPGQNYVDRTLSKGKWRITVYNAASPYQIVVTRNSWWHKVFG